jgi:hypothetical protein
MDDQQMKMMETLLGAFKTQADDEMALAADIDSGKCATKEEAKTRYGGIQMKMMGAMMGGMGGGPGMGGPGGRRGGNQPPPPKPDGGDQGGGDMGGEGK